MLALVLSLVSVQLVRVQGVDSSSLSAKALDSRLQRVSIPAQRGEIVDSKGAVLASSVDRRNVVGDPVAMASYTVKGKKVGVDGAIKKLSPLLGVPVNELRAAITKAQQKNAKSRFVYLAKDIAPTQWRAAEALGVPGLTSEHVVKREYPQGTSTSPLIGWVNSNGEPGGGVEQLMNDDLKGTPGLNVYERARNGSPIATGDNTEKAAVQGKGVQLTVDNDLQWYAQNVLAQRVKETGALSGDAVVMDVKTGQVLAAAGAPSFDNNNMADADGFLQLRPFTEVYEPGSTSKVITMAAALESKKVKPTSEVTVPSTLRRAGRPFKDSEAHGTEHLTAAGVLAKSSNMGTILIGEKMSTSLVHSYMSKFGLGRTTGVKFPGESRGILAPASQWKGDQRYTVLFGQGLAGTAIQQASVFQTVANGGVQQPVSLVKGVSDGHGGYVAPQDDRKAKRVVSKSTANSLTRMMTSVVTDGTAKEAKVPGYTVAGKTSTAQRYDSDLKKYSGTTASFIGFAPAKNPRLVVAVTIQRPKSGTYGGPVAGPAFSKLMSYALQHERIPPNGSGPKAFPLTVSTPASKDEE